MKGESEIRNKNGKIKREITLSTGSQQQHFGSDGNPQCVVITFRCQQSWSLLKAFCLLYLLVSLLLE